MRIITVIDDEEMLAEMIADQIKMLVGEDIQVNWINHWESLKSDDLDLNSLIITDKNGVGDRTSVPCQVIVCSGDDSNNCDLVKPFTLSELADILKKNKFTVNC